MTEQQIRAYMASPAADYGCEDGGRPPTVAKLIGSMLEHQQCFEKIKSGDRKWIIRNTPVAIKLLAKAVANRKAETRWITVNENTIVVNLAASPDYPSGCGQINMEHTGNGWAIVEKRASGLYVNGRKVVFFRSSLQHLKSPGRQNGHKLRAELAELDVLNGTLLDALLANQHLIPKEWEELGDCRYLVFWGTVWYVAGDRWSYRVQHMIFYGHSDEMWDEGSESLDSYPDSDYFAAILAPEVPDPRPGQLFDLPPAPTVEEPPKFETWKVIKIGTHKTAAYLIKTLQTQHFRGLCLSGGVEEIINKMPLAESETEIELVKVTPRELGLGRKKDYGKAIPRRVIYGKAKELGLDLVPAEVGPQLRLHYPDQKGESLYIAMEPIMDADNRFPKIFCLEGVSSFGPPIIMAVNSYPSEVQHRGSWIFTRRK